MRARTEKGGKDEGKRLRQKADATDQRPRPKGSGKDKDNDKNKHKEQRKARKRTSSEYYPIGIPKKTTSTNKSPIIVRCNSFSTGIFLKSRLHQRHVFVWKFSSQKFRFNDRGSGLEFRFRVQV